MAFKSSEQHISKASPMVLQGTLTPFVKKTIAYLRDISRKLEQTAGIDKTIASRLTYYEFIDHLATKIGHNLPFRDEILEPLRGRCEIKMELGEKPFDNRERLDNIYEGIIDKNYRKIKGQFLTPAQVADFMVSWGISDGCVSILDPAVGTGIFLDKASNLLRGTRYEIWGVDVDPVMLNTVSLKLAIAGITQDRFTLMKEDFLKLNFPEKKFNLVICNPPYLNFHDYNRDVDVPLIEHRFGLKLSRLTNIYALFFIQGLSFVKDNGKMVFITPSEFFYTGYGEELRKFLLKNCTIDGFVLIDFSRMVFNEALTTTVITLLRKTPAPKDHKVKFIRVLEWPDKINVLMKAVNEGVPNNRYYKLRQVAQECLDPTDKWLVHFEENGYDAIIRKLVPLSRIAEVNRGIATGHNDFFALSQKEAAIWKIEDRFLKPVISKATHIKGYNFRWNDYEILKKRQEKVFLLYCFEAPSKNLWRYIRYGEKMGTHLRYLTQHREPWYSMEKGMVAQILATVFSRARMRFIFNETGCLNLTAFHGIYPTFQSEVMVKALLAYLNSNLCKDIQVIKRREYGGGLHKFEPRDLEKLPVLDVTRIKKEDVERLSMFFDKLCESARISVVAEEEVKGELDKEIRRILQIPESTVNAEAPKLP
jgi:adenine-specific DNA-methyltransferase